MLHRSITSIGLAAALLWDMRDQLFITADGIAVIDERVSAEPTEQGLLSRLVAEGTAHPPVRGSTSSLRTGFMTRPHGA